MKRKRRLSGKLTKKFRAKIDKTTSITFYQRDLGIYCVIKKDLLDYNINIFPSEAPVTNEFLKTPDSFETVVADITVFEKEILPITIAIQDIFGDDKFISLDSVRLAVGNNDEDYVTIDESDLFSYDVEPSLQGLLQFIEGNKEGIIGFCERSYHPERGNLIFFESKLRNPDNNIKSINISILSSLQQRGLYMQQHHQYYGLQMYVTIKCDEIDDDFLELLKSLNINWEMLFFWRDLSLNNWTEIECERSAINLKAYIRSKYESLGYFDINNITKLVVKNQLSFKVADKIADLLNRAKLLREQGYISGEKSEALNKAEIAAAGKLACAYYGENAEELKFDKDIRDEDITRYVDELIKI